MDKTRKYIVLFCDVCNGEYKQQERVYKKSKWKNRCKKHRMNIEKTYCVDCGIEIYKGSTRCKKCYGKQRKKEEKHCIDCRTIIHKSATRCLCCHNKKQDKGLSKERTKFNNSKKWRDVRVMCFERDNYTCSVCGVRGGVVLNAHHIVRYVDSIELRLNLDNLVTVCESCHRDIHRKEIK
jgi:5-methylcytosine-specific restriction protein A